MAGEERRETAGITTRLIVVYIRGRSGDAGVERLLELAGEARPVAVLEDERTWSTYAQKIALFEAAAKLTGDPQVAYRVGESVLAAKLARPQQLVIGALGSPQQVLKSVARANAKFSTSATMRALETSSRHGTVGYRLHAEHTPSVHDCGYNRGLLSQVTVLFGLPPARVSHTSCQVDGAAECLYSVHWPGWRRWSPRARRRTKQTVAAALRSQVGELEQAVSELVGPGGMDAVLERIAARASVAVRAQAHLVALRLEDGRVRIHSDGLSEGDTARSGQALLDGRAPSDPGRVALVSPVASARRTYGALAAFLPTEAGFFPDEQHHLDAYASLVAAAVEVTMALEAERASARTSAALLRLSRDLVVLEDETAMAERVAAVVPLVAGADRGSVLRWDAASRSLVTLAAVGFGADTEDRLALRVPIGATPMLDRLLADPSPLRLDRGQMDPFLEGILERFRSARALVVPLRADDELLGVLVAGVSAARSGGPPDDGEERRRASGDRWGEQVEGALLGLADMAAVSIARRRLLAAAVHDANHDRLTGLPGRELLLDRLERALADLRRTGRGVAVCFVDLDGFKMVNDTHGHEAGDAVLVTVAERLRSCVRESDTVARLAGDEFIVLLRELHGIEGVTRAADGLAAALSAPVEHEGARLSIGASIGIAIAPHHGDDPRKLLRAADAAMYAVKQGGTGGYVLADRGRRAP